jgi:hypothetical protein
MPRYLSATLGLLILIGGVIAAIYNPRSATPRTIPVQSIDSVFKSCGRGGKSYLVQEVWKNIGDRPIRTVYVDIYVYNKAGMLVHQVLDYPIYSVPNSAPGVAPGETHRPGPEEGYVIPIGTDSPDDPAKCTGGITRATEEGIK